MFDQIKNVPLKQLSASQFISGLSGTCGIDFSVTNVLSEAIYRDSFFLPKIGVVQVGNSLAIVVDKFGFNFDGMFFNKIFPLVSAGVSFVQVGTNKFVIVIPECFRKNLPTTYVQPFQSRHETSISANFGGVNVRVVF